METDMIERVRAILVTPDENLLAIKRTRPGTAPYWVLPGGHVEPDDADHEAALHRELREELAGDAEIHSLVQVVDSEDESDRQYFYVARIHAWRFEDRSGPEFTDPDPARGSYELQQIPLTPEALASIDLKPEPTAELIRQSVATHDGLYALPDLRPLPANHP
jgi:ADP-ribose pyrophosphatase YjhB (NUDIX family)